MFHLIESRFSRKKSPVTVAVSATLHGALLIGAVWATADGRTERPKPAYEVRLFAPQPARAEAPRAAAKPAVPVRRTEPTRVAPATRAAAPAAVPTSIPPAGEAEPGPATESADVAGAPGGFPDGTGTSDLGSADGEPVTVDVVDRVARSKRAVVPRYPEFLRRAGLEGRVVVRFVVDTAGAVERDIRVVESSHDAFAEAVRSALSRARFEPAMVRGERVRLLMEQSFVFKIER